MLGAGGAGEVDRARDTRLDRPGASKVPADGSAFTPEYAERIFGLFKRLHGHDIPGLGVGLGICRRIVERHGRRIWAESNANRRGATFFTLPAIP